METQAITVRLELPVYELLRREAFDERTSQNSIINAELRDRYERAGLLEPGGGEHGGEG